MTVPLIQFYKKAIVNSGLEHNANLALSPVMMTATSLDLPGHKIQTTVRRALSWMKLELCSSMFDKR